MFRYSNTRTDHRPYAHPRVRRVDYTDPEVLVALTGGTSPWMSRDEVMELLHVSRSTLDQWRARGDFPEGKQLPNRKMLWPRPLVAQFIDKLPDV